MPSNLDESVGNITPNLLLGEWIKVEREEIGIRKLMLAISMDRL
jgi:hypothetical protein